MFSLSFAALAAASILGTSASPIGSRQYPGSQQVEFNFNFPAQWCSGHTYNFQFQGGNGAYNLVQALSSSGSSSPSFDVLLQAAPQSFYEWTAPGTDQVPDDSTYYFIIEQADHPENGTTWFQDSPTLALISCD